MTEQLRRARLRAQRLEPATAARSAPDVVRRLVGLQAQLPSATALVVRARTVGLTAERLSSPWLVRTWAMRGTLHLLAAVDVDWVLGLLSPVVLAGRTRRYAELDLDDATLRRSVDVLVDLLHAGPANRKELFAGLAARGIDPAGQRGVHLIQHAAMQRVLCFGPDRDGEPTWVRRTARPALDTETALGELAHRYRTGYGPADAGDLAYWSGLPMRQARLAWQLAGPQKDPPAASGTAPSVRLLPHFDPYLLGYRSRDFSVPRARQRLVATGGGFVTPTVMVDGRAVGTWRTDRGGQRLTVTIVPFDGVSLGGDLRAGVQSEVADIGRFLSADATLRWPGSAG